MSYQLPLDVFQHIINILAAETKHNSPTYLDELRACSLACRSLLDMSRKHIFRYVRIYDNKKSTEKFCQLLEDAPAIANLVQHVKFSCPMQKPGDEAEPEVTSRRELLSRGVAKLSHVRSLYLYSIDDVPGEVLPAIIHLLGLPTCTFVTLSCRFPAAYLAHCPNLECLDIDLDYFHATRDLGPNQRARHPLDGEYIQFSPDTTPPQPVEFRYTAFRQHSVEDPSVLEDSIGILLIEAKRPDGLPLIDWTHLKKVSIRGAGKEGASTLKHVLEKGGQVEEIRLNTSVFRKPWTLFYTIRSALITLKVLRLDIEAIAYFSSDPLRKLLEQLNLLSMEENVIEMMCFSFRLFGDLEPGNEWVKLDSLLCRPCWPALKFVSLTLCASKSDISESRSPVFHTDRPLDLQAPVQIQWKDLPSQQFPMLSSSNTIEFDFSLG